LLQLLQGCPPGIQFNDHIEGDGAEIFAHAWALSARTAQVHIGRGRARPGSRSRIFRHRACFASRIAILRRDPEWLRRQIARLVRRNTKIRKRPGDWR
jgi:hypothetical protein